MGMKRGLTWVGVLLSILVLIVLSFVRGMGISAKRDPTALEERVAKAVWRFLVPPEHRTLTNPVPATPEVIRAGLEHWADHCATCHANDGSGETEIGRGLHPPAPDMRMARTQHLTDGELFYAIEEGIPFTGMPAWGTGTDDGERSSWELVRLIRRLPDLSAEELRDMEQLNPRSPADEQRKQEIDDFLAGKD